MAYEVESVQREESFDDTFINAKFIKLGNGRLFYVYKDDAPYLSVEISGNSYYFCEAVIFNDCLAIGNYDKGVAFIDLHDFTVRLVEVDHYFGYFKIADSVIYVLGCCNVMAFDSHLDLKWKTAWLAVDGVVFKALEGDTMVVSCEMDPPGGWIDRRISLTDGSVLE